MQQRSTGDASGLYAGMSDQSGDALVILRLDFSLDMVRGGTSRCGTAIQVPATTSWAVSTKVNRSKTVLAAVFSTDFTRHVL